jgi:hypothetical protein
MSLWVALEREAATADVELVGVSPEEVLVKWNEGRAFAQLI